MLWLVTLQEARGQSLTLVVDSCQNDFPGTLFTSFMQIESLVIKRAGENWFFYLIYIYIFCTLLNFSNDLDYSI